MILLAMRLMVESIYTYFITTIFSLEELLKFKDFTYLPNCTAYYFLTQKVLMFCSNPLFLGECQTHPKDVPLLKKSNTTTIAQLSKEKSVKTRIRVEKKILEMTLKKVKFTFNVVAHEANVSKNGFTNKRILELGKDIMWDTNK